MNTENQTSRDNSRIHGANGSHLKCKQWSFKFADAKARFIKLLTRKEEVLESFPEKPSPFKKITAIAAIIVGIGLAFLEASNLSATISATTGLSSGMAMVVGGLFSIVGMLAGEMVANIKRDEFTGKIKITFQQILGSILILIYLGGQYFIARSAESGSGDMQGTVHSMTIYIVSIGLLQVVFGALFLRTGIQVVSILVMDIRLRLITRTLNQTSRITDSLWNRHLFEIQAYNEANGTNVPHGEFTQSIQDAVNFYSSGGFAGGVQF